MRCATLHDPFTDQTPEVELDQDGNIQWCIDYLKNDAPPSILGRNGEKAMLDVYGVLKDRGVSYDKAVELIDQYYNVEPKCSPIWNCGDGPEADRHDLKGRNAYTYLKEKHARLGDSRSGFWRRSGRHVEHRPRKHGRR